MKKLLNYIVALILLLVPVLLSLEVAEFLFPEMNTHDRDLIAIIIYIFLFVAFLKFFKSIDYLKVKNED